jgi:hypothetical protein
MIGQLCGIRAALSDPTVWTANQHSEGLVTYCAEYSGRLCHDTYPTDTSVDKTYTDSFFQLGTQANEYTRY